MSKQGGVYGAASKALQGAGNIYNTPNAVNAAGPAKISAGIPGYMNPYTSDVIDRSRTDVQRLTDLQQDANAAGAVGAGAFGGARHGLVEAVTNSEAQKNFGDLASGLRRSGWETAAGLAGQDVANLQQNRQYNAGAQNAWDMSRAAGGANLGTTAFDIGQTIGGQQGEQGGLAQQLIQSIMGGAGGQYNTFMGGPQNLLNLQLAALGMNPLTAATNTTTTSTPGLFDWMSMIAQSYGMSKSG